jgi:hypothetical protein
MNNFAKFDGSQARTIQTIKAAFELDGAYRNYQLTRSEMGGDVAVALYGDELSIRCDALREAIR